MINKANKRDFDFFMERLLTSAVEDYRATAKYALQKERVDQMHEDCETNFNTNDREYAEECFYILKGAEGEQQTYLYRKGITDCIYILKNLGVLA